MTSGYTDRLVAFLKKEVGGAGFSNEQVRDFSQTLKDLDIINLSDSRNAQWVMETPVGQQVLIQLISWYSLGLLTNLKILIKTIKQKD